ncbi:MAG: hypothetical protein AMJ60_07530 [Desulfobacterales bacterium SG8_35]|nr:MAG: hypothetical protein AMJ60_07530 [Desulfobacterales bacterium SG8_35]
MSIEIYFFEPRTFMPLSRKAKEAIKVALAMTIAYGIALQMNWDKPYWAGFAVAFVSLATVGQSFNKAANRMFGTLVATVVALTVIGLFPQDRWLFMLILSGWVGFCTYMMGGTKYQYFWNLSGFASIVICVSAGMDSANAFRIAILRSQETGLGILVYSLVAILLWPTRSRGDFDAAAVKLSETQRQLYQASLEQMGNKDKTDATQELRTHLLQVQTRFGQLLEAAETDSYEVWEMRQQWQKFQRLSTDFAGTMAGWHGNFIELQLLDVKSLIPNLETFSAELDKRFAEVERMLAGKPPEQQPAPIDLTLNKTGIQSMSHFHRAALAVTRKRLNHLETLSRSLFETVNDIQGFDQKAKVPVAKPQPSGGFVFDPDRLTGVFHVMTILWLAYLAVIYVPDIPGGGALVSMAGVFGMILAGTPQLPVSKMFMPVAGSVLFGGVIHIFVMPQLSSFYELGLLLFATIFGICYLFAAPQQALSKVFGMALFIKVAGITNQQTYSFLGVATTAMLFMIIFLLLTIIVNIPFSARPEKVFLRLLGRYFRSCGYLIHNMHRDTQKQEKRFDRWQKNYHKHQLASLPKKLGVWARFIDTKVLPGTEPPQIQTVLTGLQALSYRMQESLAESDKAQSPFLLQELQSNIKAWRDRVEEILQRLTDEFDAGKKETLGARLTEIIDRLEQRIEETLDKAAENQLSKQDNENFYQLLGAYRGVSEALVDYAGTTEIINWNLWREERF